MSDLMITHPLSQETEDSRPAHPLPSDIVAYSFELGQRILGRRSEEKRRELGQFLTTPEIARYMVRRLGFLPQGCRVLDPATGSGILVAALIEHIVTIGFPTALTIRAYEVDEELVASAREVLAIATDYAAENGIYVQAEVHQADFVLTHAEVSKPSLFSLLENRMVKEMRNYDVIIANPPYFKLHSQDSRVQATAGLVAGHTNIYTLFMALAAQLLATNGCACFIVPRSFCSGAYFAKFRRDLISQARPTHVHLFESRYDTFKADNVLQENIIILFRKQLPPNIEKSLITVSASLGTNHLQRDLIYREVSPKQFLGKRNGTIFFRLPVTELDQIILETVDSWPGALAHYGWEVSTGPVVPFRAKNLLREIEAVEQGSAVPLLWMYHVSAQLITWPIKRGNKSQAIAKTASGNGLLLPAHNYVLTRRFSAKEERRRLIAAPFLRQAYEYDTIGLENHLNFIYGVQGELEVTDVLGLSALLNSALIDRYFRISNGNTQVNAIELRALPLPDIGVIRRIGHEITEVNVACMDDLVFSVLRETGYLPDDFPTIQETRYSMGKIQEAQEILKALGLPRPQQNEISALTLLVLAQLSEDTPWMQATQRSLRIHDILLEIQTRYGRQYAENTRETIRRQVIHQFIQAGLVLRNPDDLTLSTNSPRSHYALSIPALETIQAYDSPAWPDAAQAFLENQRALIETYHLQREQHRVPLIIERGIEYHLSPGVHNQLQVAIIEEFGPRFAPGAKVLYVGDTANKTLHVNIAGLESLGISITRHDKLPDILLYDEEKNWLYLIEAVTSHGPISPKRYIELQDLITSSSASAVFVTAFPDFNTFKNFLFEIAWETEVWVADKPAHLIHFNGDHFLRPHS
jgi:adenine-specific DNA-methyltransferase